MSASTLSPFSSIHARRPEASPLPISSVNIFSVSCSAPPRTLTGSTRRVAGSMVVSRS